MAETPRASTSETRLALPSDKFFRIDYQARAIADLINVELVFDRMFPKVQIPTRAFWYRRKSVSGTRYSDATDPKKEYPPPMEHGGKIAKVTVSDYQELSDTVEQYSFGFDIGLDSREEVQGIDYVVRARNSTGYWMAESINAGIVTSVLNDFSVTSTTDVAAMADMMTHIASDMGYEDTVGHIVGVLDSDNYWDEAGADPVVDILDLLTVFDNQTGFWFRGTDVYMTNRALNLFNKFIINHGGTWARDPTGAGWITNAVGGVTFHGLKNDVAGWEATTGDDYIWMVDRNNPAATSYYYTSSEYPNMGGINYHTWKEDESKVQTYQFWYSRKTVVREPTAMAVLKVRD